MKMMDILRGHDPDEDVAVQGINQPAPLDPEAPMRNIPTSGAPQVTPDPSAPPGSLSAALEMAKKKPKSPAQMQEVHVLSDQLRQNNIRLRKTK